MLSTTTLQIAFNKTSPDPTQDRLRVLKRKGVKKSNKRVRFADDMEFGSFRTGQADPSNTSAAPNHYNEGDTKKGAPTLKPDIDPKDPKPLLPDTKPKDPKDPPGDKPKPSPEDDPKKPSLWSNLWSNFKKHAYIMVFIFMVIVLVDAFLRLKDRQTIKSLTAQLAQAIQPSTNSTTVSRNIIKPSSVFHMQPVEQVFSLFGM